MNKHFQESGRLLGEYIVDMFSRWEDCNLKFQRQNNASNNRTVMLSIKKKNLEKSKETNEKISGSRRTILGSSFTGSNRYKHKKSKQAMALANEDGIPHYFLTMTCNPQWREIVENLSPGQKASDRPDLIARVFKIKLDELIRCLKESDWCGSKATYIVYTIEEQEKGLLHVHLIFRTQMAPPRTSEEILKVVQASVPQDRATKEMTEEEKQLAEKHRKWGSNSYASRSTYKSKREKITITSRT